MSWLRYLSETGNLLSIFCFYYLLQRLDLISVYVNFFVVVSALPVSPSGWNTEHHVGGAGGEVREQREEQRKRHFKRGFLRRAFWMVRMKEGDTHTHSKKGVFSSLSLSLSLFLSLPPPTKIQSHIVVNENTNLTTYTLSI